MAFTDVIDRKNLETVLVLKLELRTVAGGAGGTFYLGDRYMEATVDGASRVISGLVKDWGGFGYQADFVSFESVVADCTFTLSVQDELQVLSWPILEKLHDEELIGARVTIFQLALWAGTWESRQVWKGMVREPPQVSTAGLVVSAVDLTPMQGLTPNVVISKANFPNAPDSSIGRSVPIAFGDFLEFEAANPREVSPQRFGMGTFRGIPGVCIDDGKDLTEKAGKWLHLCHGAKATSPNTGVAFHSPGHRDRTGFLNTYWTLTNTAGAPGTGSLESELEWPLIYNYMPAFPMGIATLNTATNPENAWDRDYSTSVTMTTGSGQTKILQATIPAVSPSGMLVNLAVVLWVISCSPANKINFGLWDVAGASYESVWANIGSGEAIWTKGCLAGSELWDCSDYQLRATIPENTTAVIRAIMLQAQYRPSTSPMPYRYRHPPPALKTFGGLDYGYDVAAYKRRVAAEGTEPSDIQVMAYASGLKDDGSGTYTGTPDALVEHSADQMHYLLGEFSDLASTDIAGSSDHGSFTTARTALGTYHKLGALVVEKQPNNQMLHRLAIQSRSVPIWNADGKRGIIALTPAPSPNYRSGSTFKFYADEHIEANTFKFGRTPLEQIVNQVYVDFDFDYGANEFRRTTFVSESDSDNGFGTRDQSTIREAKASTSQSRFQVTREYRLKAYDVVAQGVAKQIRNFIFDWWWRSKLWIEFETYLNASDLSVGHVIQLGDEYIHGMEIMAPDDGGDHWDDMTWWVMNVQRIAGTGTTPRYRVRGLEAVPCLWTGNWIATADD